MAKIQLRNRTLISILVVVVVIVAITAIISIRILSTPAYVGKNVQLTKADSSTTFQINGAALTIPPIPKSGVQSNINITKFSGSFAQGTVSYSDKSPTQNFMAIKTDDKWVIIAHNTGKSLSLPDEKTAKKYNLPKGWYKS